MVKGLLLSMMLLAGCSEQIAPTQLESARTSAAPTQTIEKPIVATAQHFWSEFRIAALAADHTQLQKLTRFPFTTRGSTDDDPSISPDAAAFIDLVPKILEQDVGLSAEPETVRQYIERHPELPAVAIGAGQSRVLAPDATQFFAGPLGFERVGERWYWVSASLEVNIHRNRE